MHGEKAPDFHQSYRSSETQIKEALAGCSVNRQPKDLRVHGMYSVLLELRVPSIVLGGAECGLLV